MIYDIYFVDNVSFIVTINTGLSTRENPHVKLIFFINSHVD